MVEEPIVAAVVETAAEIENGLQGGVLSTLPPSIAAPPGTPVGITLTGAQGDIGQLSSPIRTATHSLTVNAIGRLVLNPHRSEVTIVLVSPSKMIYFRPKRSEARPQGMAVVH